MVRQVAENIFCIQMVFSNDLLDDVNCYLVRGERSLLIDTGFDRQMCREVLKAALDELGVGLDSLDILMTHHHFDHSGLAPKLLRPGMKVYTGPYEAGKPKFFKEKYLYKYEDCLSKWGLPDKEFTWLLTSRCADYTDACLKLEEARVCTPLADGDRLEYGGYTFECMYTPGHCEDHICLYEPELKLLMCGDFVLGNITPLVSDIALKQQNLLAYLKALARAAKLDVDIVCPGHGSQFNLKERILHIYSHHFMRMDQIMRALGSGPRTLAQVVPMVIKRYNCDDWSKFFRIEVLMTLTDTLSHLSFLCDEGLVNAKEAEDGFIYFSKMQ